MFQSSFLGGAEWQSESCRIRKLKLRRSRRTTTLTLQRGCGEAGWISPQLRERSRRSSRIPEHRDGFRRSHGVWNILGRGDLKGSGASQNRLMVDTGPAHPDECSVSVSRHLSSGSRPAPLQIPLTRFVVSASRSTWSLCLYQLHSRGDRERAQVGAVIGRIALVSQRKTTDYRRVPCSRGHKRQSDGRTRLNRRRLYEDVQTSIRDRHRSRRFCPQERMGKAQYGVEASEDHM